MQDDNGSTEIGKYMIQIHESDWSIEALQLAIHIPKLKM